MNFQTFDQQQQQYIQHIQQKFVEFCVCANSKSALSQTPTRALPETSFCLVLLHFHRAYIEYFKIRRSFCAHDYAEVCTFPDRCLNEKEPSFHS